MFACKTNIILILAVIMNLDQTDFAIIKHLQNNARLSNKELSGLIGLAPSSCLSRVRNLLNRNVLKKFSVEIDRKAMGIDIQAMLTLTFTNHSKEKFSKLTEYLRNQPEVYALYHLSGVNDVLIHVMVKDTNHLRDFVMDKVTSQEEVDRCDTSLIYNEYRNHTIPNYIKKSR